MRHAAPSGFPFSNMHPTDPMARVRKQKGMRHGVPAGEDQGLLSGLRETCTCFNWVLMII